VRDDRIVRIVGLANGQRHHAEGEWLVSYDPYAHGGRGEMTTTPYRAEATRFTLIEFHRLYSTAVGIRPDGKPNRPLTAFHLTVEPADLSSPGNSRGKRAKETEQSAP
jgi:hypothetical protein